MVAISDELLARLHICKGAAGPRVPLYAPVALGRDHLLLGFFTLNRLGASDVCGGSEAAMAVYVQEMIGTISFCSPR